MSSQLSDLSYDSCAESGSESSQSLVSMPDDDSQHEPWLSRVDLWNIVRSDIIRIRYGPGSDDKTLVYGYLLNKHSLRWQRAAYSVTPINNYSSDNGPLIYDVDWWVIMWGTSDMLLRQRQWACTTVFAKWLLCGEIVVEQRWLTKYDLLHVPFECIDFLAAASHLPDDGSG